MYKLSRLAALFIVFLLAVSPALATTKLVPLVGREASSDGSVYVLVNRERAIHLRTRNADLTPTDRVNIVVERLSGLVRQGLDPKTITFRSTINDARVMVGDSLLVIATQAEARAHNLTPAQLAERWVQNLRRCLALPPLSADPTTLLVPLGEVRFITVKSLLPSPVQADVADASLISVDSEVRPGSLAVTGVALGQTTITLRCEGYAFPIQVQVRKYAAYRSPGTTGALVTGHNAPASLISRTAVEATRRSVSLETGARIQSVSAQKVDRDLAPGQKLKLDVQLEATGEAYIPAKISVPVEVENRIIRADATAYIMYSNHPEQVLGYQLLFASQTMTSESPYRLLYHHQNRMSQRIGFVIDVVNTSDSPASLHLIEGIAPPILCTVIVGYNAGMSFVENHRKRIGRVIELPPGARQAIVSQAVDAPHTASGIVELHQLSGDPLLVRVLTKPDSQRILEDPLGVSLSAGRLDPSRITMSDHVYPEPVRKLEATYTVGRQWVFLRMGREALRHASQDMLLYGNYGVIYDIRATLDNPLDRPQEIEIAFEPTAGPAGGVFLVDNSLVHMRYMVPPSEHTISKVTVPAGGSRTVSIRTVPLSGSAYPATIIIRPTGRVIASSDAK